MNSWYLPTTAPPIAYENVLKEWGPGFLCYYTFPQNSCFCLYATLVSNPLFQSTTIQTWSRSQCPRTIESVRSFRAASSWPWPIDSWRISWHRSLAMASICGDGSDPTDRRQIRGVRLSDSSSMDSRSRTVLSRYSAPNESKMYFLAWDRVRSGHL